LVRGKDIIPILVDKAVKHWRFDKPILSLPKRLTTNRLNSQFSLRELVLAPLSIWERGRE
jgi:hypothetical protein